MHTHSMHTDCRGPLCTVTIDIVGVVAATTGAKQPVRNRVTRRSQDATKLRNQFSVHTKPGSYVCIVLIDR